MNKTCKECEHFVVIYPGTNIGKCTRLAPMGINSQMVPLLGSNANIFPGVFNAITEWCGDFQPRH